MAIISDTKSSIEVLCRAYQLTYGITNHVYQNKEIFMTCDTKPHTGFLILYGYSCRCYGYNASETILLCMDPKASILLDP